MIIQNGYIVAVAQTDEQYDTVMDALGKVPEAENGFQYKLRADDLEWELVELPPVEPEEEEPTVEDKAEAYDILMGANE